MAFGYALLKGRGGAAGYVRESGGRREISVRNLQPDTSCSLYTVQDGEYRLAGTATADSAGNAKWKAPMEGFLFISAGNKVLLWEGGDEAFLHASAWLDKKKQEVQEKTEEPKTDDIPEARSETREIPNNPTKSGLDCAKQTEVSLKVFEYHLPSDVEKKTEKESPPERAYALRPAGAGEPVDTLPERQRR